MRVKEPTAADVEREMFIARIFGAYADYLKSLPARVWERSEHGWVSRACAKDRGPAQKPRKKAAKSHV